jgi:hypothetical protein
MVFTFIIIILVESANPIPTAGMGVETPNSTGDWQLGEEEVLWTIPIFGSDITKNLNL